MKPDFDGAFAQLRSMYNKYEPNCVVLHDEPGKYYLGTHDVRADGYRVWFGGVEIKKNYVSAHAMTFYLFPDLVESVSQPLRKRKQGKSCFNFKAPDRELFQEFEQLLERSVERYRVTRLDAGVAK